MGWSGKYQEIVGKTVIEMRIGFGPGPQGLKSCAARHTLRYEKLCLQYEMNNCAMVCGTVLHNFYR